MRSSKRAVPITPAQIGAELVKLCRYVDSLERSVRRLAARIEPFAEEQPFQGSPWLEIFDGHRLKATPEAFLTVIRQADAHLRSVEFGIDFIKARIDQISNDSWSRDELRPYLDSDQKRAPRNPVR
jgi:hypothetical protein